MIKRTILQNQLRAALKRSRAVVLVGPRQCGKTTLARQLIDVKSHNYFDLEDPADLAQLQEPMTALRELKGLVIIDEIQRSPELFPVLRVLLDRKPLPARFLVLGSASPELLKQSSESLAGRQETISMSGFSLEDLKFKSLSKHWLRGGFPLSYLAGAEKDSYQWRKSFIQTFLERDLPQFGIRISPTSLYRFWTMLAHYHGRIWNAAEPARSLGISESSARRYLDVLSDLFMIRQLQPWHANVKKRQVKAPKIYFRDTGLLHQLLGIRTQKELMGHPKCGLSWEGYVMEEIIGGMEEDQVYFWGTHGGAEVDLVLVKQGQMFGIECKRADAPRLTPSMKYAMADMKLKRLAVIYPGKKRYVLEKNIQVIPFEEIIRRKTVF